jgi:RND family efflux transporter MFP subunit
MIEPRGFQLSEGGFRRLGTTLFMALLAVVAGRAMWEHYMLSAWTRDGRVRAETVNVAAEIFGKVTEVKVMDNQFVKKGELLFTIDAREFELAVARTEASLESRRQEMLVHEELSKRRSQLSALAVSKEEQQTSESSASVSQAAYQEAKAQRDLAKLNLERTRVLAPCNGYVTNLRLRTGDYAMVGQTKLTVIDSDSYWVSGYFEETKMPRITEGDRATVELMGVTPPLEGHVESISRGIADQNGGVDAQGLVNVNPVFYWVRLAQRIPVRIHLDRTPEGVLLAAGASCTVTVHHDEKNR